MKLSITISLVAEARGGPFVFWDNLGGAISTAARMGFDAIEIFPPDADTLRREPLEKMVGDAGIRVAAVGTGGGWVKHRLQLADESPIVRERAIDFVRSIIDVAGELGASAIIGSMQGRSSSTVDNSRARNYLIEGLSLLGEHANQYRTTVLYEPLNRYETDQANTLEQGVRIIEGLSHVQLLADWFHMNIEEADLGASIVAAGHKIGHVHFADTNRSAVGFGHLSVQPLIEALRSIHYRGYLSAEVFPKPSSDAAAAQTMAAFRQFVL